MWLIPFTTQRLDQSASLNSSQEEKEEEGGDRFGNTRWEYACWFQHTCSPLRMTTSPLDTCRSLRDTYTEYASFAQAPRQVCSMLRPSKYLYQPYISLPLERCQSGFASSFSVGQPSFLASPDFSLLCTPRKARSNGRTEAIMCFIYTLQWAQGSGPDLSMRFDIDHQRRLALSTSFSVERHDGEGYECYDDGS